MTSQGEILLQKDHPTNKSTVHCLWEVLGLDFSGCSVAQCAVGSPQARRFCLYTGADNTVLQYRVVNVLRRTDTA